MTSPAPIMYAAGLYWRKSLLNGRKCVPAILSVTNGRLRLASAKELAFDVPCPQASFKVSTFSTLTIRIDGRKYDIVGRGSGISPEFTKEQKAELEQRKAQAAQLPNGGIPPTRGSAPIAGGAAVLDVLGGGGADLINNIQPWRTILPVAGVASG